MAQVQDTLVTRFVLKDDFSGVASKVTSNLGKITHGLDRLKAGIVGAASRIGAFAGGALAAAGGGLLALGVAAIRSASDFQALKMGLEAVAGSAQEANIQFARLEKLAELPGLDLEPLVRGSIALQASEMSARDAEAAMVQFGNALATVGRGPADLTDVIYGLQQLATAPTVLAEDLNIIKERVPQVAAILKNLYGTARSDEIAKKGILPKDLIAAVVAELSKLPRFAGGAQNAFVNFASAVKRAFAAIGTPLLAPVTQAINMVANGIGNLVNSGALEKLSGGLANFFNGDWVGSQLLYALSVVLAAFETLPAALENLQANGVKAFNQLRASFIQMAGIIVNFAVSGAVIQGVMLIVRAFMALRAAIAGAAAAQAVLTGMTVVGAAAVLAGLAMGALTMKALDETVPKIDDPSKDDPSRIKSDFEKSQEAWLEKLSQGAQSVGAPIAGMGPAGNPVASAVEESGLAMQGEAVEQTGYLREISANTRDMLQLEQRIMGGGTIGAAAASPVKIQQAISGARSGGGNVEKQVWALVNAIKKEMFGATELAYGRLGNSPVRL